MAVVPSGDDFGAEPSRPLQPASDASLARARSVRQAADNRLATVRARKAKVEARLHELGAADAAISAVRTRGEQEGEHRGGNTPSARGVPPLRSLDLT